VADRQGNVVTYTFTIEQIGGSAMVVPGYGFLLNNELTDFNFSRPARTRWKPFKRPRSSMSPTIVMRTARSSRPSLARRLDHRDHRHELADRPAGPSA